METSVKYPNLEGEIAKRGIMKSRIAERLGLSYGAFYQKLNGKTSFTWDEACTLQSTFFPDMNKDVLFDHSI